MRKLITGLSVAAVTAAAVAMPTLASAEPAYGRSEGLNSSYAAPLAGSICARMDPSRAPLDAPPGSSSWRPRLLY